MKQGLFLIFAFCAISNAYAQMDCESIPSCAELGYTQASCPEGNASLKCPFDETKFYCIGGKKLADAPAPVITPENWTASCADTIAHCTTLDSSCRCTACESGYLVANGNCVSECDKSVAICAKESKIFKADTCTCEACPENYQFNSETKTCEQIACDITKIENCATYDSDYEPCDCESCVENYELSADVDYDGKKKCCPRIEKCNLYGATSCRCAKCLSPYFPTSNGCEKPSTFCDFENCSVYHCGNCWDNDCIGYGACSKRENICRSCGAGYSARGAKGEGKLEDGTCKRYVYNSNKSKKSYCAPGEVMYNDFKCYTTEQNDKTPIGVVAYYNRGYYNNKVYVLALSDSDEEELIIGSSNVYSKCSLKNGKEQTECLIANGIEEDSAPAYCNSYGVTESDKGKWFLPTNDELRKIFDNSPYLFDNRRGESSWWKYGYLDRGDFCYTVQTLQKYNAPSSEILDYVNSKFLNKEYWSSNRYLVRIENGNVVINYKFSDDTKGLVRCVLEVPLDDTVL